MPILPDLEVSGLPQVARRMPLSTDHEGPPASAQPSRSAGPGKTQAGSAPTAPLGKRLTRHHRATAPGTTQWPAAPSMAGSPRLPGAQWPRKRCTAEGVLRASGDGCPPAPPGPGLVRGSYLAKTFLAMRVRAVSACCFRSVRPGYFLFLPLPLLPALDEPRSTPVAASTSLINSGSCQSANRPETSENTWHQPLPLPDRPR